MLIASSEIYKQIDQIRTTNIVQQMVNGLITKYDFRMNVFVDFHIFVFSLLELI